MKRVFFVDTENLLCKRIMQDAETLTLEDKVVIFHNALLREHLPDDVTQKIKKYAGKVVVENITCRGKNAMDMQICTYLGYYIAKENINGTQFYILSGDKGYEDAIKIATQLLLKTCETATLQRAEGFAQASQDMEVRSQLKQILKNQSKKVITVTTTAFTKHSSLRDYQVYLQKNIPVSADEVYRMTKPYFVQEKYK